MTHARTAPPAAGGTPIGRGPGGLADTLATLLPDAAEGSRAGLAARARIAPFARGHRIVPVDGEPRLVLLLDGYAGTWRSDPDGRSQLVALNGPGELAALGSLSPRREPTEIAGLTPGQAGTWDPDEVRAIGRADAGLAVDLLDLALRAGDRLMTRLEHIGFDSVSRRLARLLWQRRELLFDPRRPLLSRPQLAELAGATREMVDRVIRDLESRGIVERVGTTGLVLLDPHGLHLLAGDDDERECS